MSSTRNRHPSFQWPALNFFMDSISLIQLSKDPLGSGWSQPVPHGRSPSPSPRSTTGSDRPTAATAPVPRGRGNWVRVCAGGRLATSVDRRIDTLAPTDGARGASSPAIQPNGKTSDPVSGDGQQARPRNTGPPVSRGNGAEGAMPQRSLRAPRSVGPSAAGSPIKRRSLHDRDSRRVTLACDPPG